MVVVCTYTKSNMKLKKCLTTFLISAAGLTVVIGLSTGITTAIVKNNTANIHYLRKYILPVQVNNQQEYEWINFHGSKMYYYQNECFTTSGKDKKAVLVQFKEPQDLVANSTLQLPWQVNYQDSSYILKQIDAHTFMNIEPDQPLKMTLILPMTVTSFSINNQNVDFSLPADQLISEFSQLLPNGFFNTKLFAKVVILNPHLYQQVLAHPSLFNPHQEIIFQNQN